MANNELIPSSMPPIEHIRKCSGMYIGKLGDGGNSDDGIYIILDIVMWFAVHLLGTKFELVIEGKQFTLRCSGGAIPFDNISSVVTDIQDGYLWNGRHDMFGLVVVNALSSEFSIASTIDGQRREYKYRESVEVCNTVENRPTDVDSTQISYIVDESLSGEYNYNLSYIEAMIREVVSINRGVEIVFNGMLYHSENGMLDLLNYRLSEDTFYSPIHLHSEIIDIAFTHNSAEERGELYEMFANGFRVRSGTLVTAVRGALPKIINEIYDLNFHKDAILGSIHATVSIKIDNPTFPASIKWNLTSKDIREGLPMTQFLEDFLRDSLKKYLIQHPQTADLLLSRINQSEDLIKRVEVFLANKKIKRQGDEKNLKR